MGVVGGGIVGLATAARLAARGAEVILLEKEPGLAAHQTGRNSGVVHAGLYYAPGSLKATMAVAGGRSIDAYARARGVAVDRCGKLVVANTPDELVGLQRLADRAQANGVDARLLEPAEAREFEPYVRCKRALHVRTTGIIDYRGVCAALSQDIQEAGGHVRTGAEVVAIEDLHGSLRVQLRSGAERVDGLVACAGLQADRVALLAGLVPQARIVPFRGEYYELVPQKHYLVRNLIYPVPDPRFPFLGVHLTRMIHGGVHAGPNAVLALKREGYSWRAADAGELWDSLSWPGLWRLARRNVVPGLREIYRSLSPKAFAASLSRLVPGIEAQDLRPSPSGVRAQALRRDGSLVEDFLVQRGPRQVHVLNAPSPAATAALEIAAHVVSALDEQLSDR
ncbi:MAG: L-2-hydroxyglutarate oxidase [Actinomycetales bacterium]|nr:MAG: L-2-hydroxyglutarate oxidase [Actinomycetales bacterium]